MFIKYQNRLFNLDKTIEVAVQENRLILKYGDNKPDIVLHYETKEEAEKNFNCLPHVLLFKELTTGGEVLVRPGVLDDKPKRGRPAKTI